MGFVIRYIYIYESTNNINLILIYLVATILIFSTLKIYYIISWSKLY